MKKKSYYGYRFFVYSSWICHLAFIECRGIVYKQGWGDRR